MDFGGRSEGSLSALCETERGASLKTPPRDGAEQSGRESVKPGGTAGVYNILSQQKCRDRIFIFQGEVHEDVHIVQTMAGVKDTHRIMNINPIKKLK